MRNKYALEIRVNRIKVQETANVSMDCPETCFKYWKDIIEKQSWYSHDKEHLAVLILNTRLKIVGHSLISIGTLNESIAHPRDIFRSSIALGAYGIILMHNHPSGDPSPSQADIKLTKDIKKGADLLQIKFLDHVIVGDDYKSLYQIGIF